LKGYKEEEGRAVAMTGPGGNSKKQQKRRGKERENMVLVISKSLHNNLIEALLIQGGRRHSDNRT